MCGGEVVTRLRFYLFLLDVLHTFRAPRSVYLWCVGKCSDATEWE